MRRFPSNFFFNHRSCPDEIKKLTTIAYSPFVIAMECLIGVPATLATMWCCCKAAFPEGTVKSNNRVVPDDMPRKMTPYEIEIYNRHMALYGSGIEKN